MKTMYLFLTLNVVFLVFAIVAIVLVIGLLFAGYVCMNPRLDLEKGNVR